MDIKLICQTVGVALKVNILLLVISGVAVKMNMYGNE
jgi:hypothetical protein